MAPTRKQREAVAPEQHDADPTAAPGVYTRSYLVAQTISPPRSSSPVPEPSVLDNARCDHVPAGPERAGGDRSGGRSNGRSRNAARARNGSSDAVAANETSSRVVARRPEVASKRARLISTQTLTQVLAKNKELLFKCLTSDGEGNGPDCVQMMEKISKKVQDDRFQAWKQVKTWLMLNRRRILRGRRKSSYQTGSLFDHLIPVLDVSELHSNIRKFADSVLGTIGTDKLKKAFNHRLDSDSLPEDTSTLFLSPVLSKLCQKQIRRATSNRNYSDSNDSDSVQSESDDDYDPQLVTSATPIPSVETERETDVVPSPVEAAGRYRNRQTSEPMLPLVEDQEVDSCPKSSRKTHELMEVDVPKIDAERNIGRFARKESSLLLRQSSPTLNSSPTHVPKQVQNQVVVYTAPHQTLERQSSSVPAIRPFSDFRSQASIASSDKDVESGSVIISQAKKLLLGEHDRRDGNMKSIKRTAKKEAAKRRKKRSRAPPIPVESQPVSRPMNGSAPKPGIVGRPTPAILAEENRRHRLKLAKPRVPTQVPSRRPPSGKPTPRRTKHVHAHREINPPAFYHSAVDGSVNIETTASHVWALQPSTPLQPLLNDRALQVSKPGTPLAQKGSSHRKSVISDQSSEFSWPSPEVLFGRTKPQLSVAALEGSASLGNADKNRNDKRQRLETPVDWITPARKQAKVEPRAGHSRGNSGISNTPRDARQCNQISDDRPSFPPTPSSGKKGRQDNLRVDTRSRADEPFQQRGWDRPWKQESWRGPCDPHSSSSFRGQTAPPQAMGDERHSLYKLIPSIEHGDAPAAIIRQGRHRFMKFQSRKPYEG